MNWLRRKTGLPLLAKELVEMAARKRTYIVRVVYAVLLFGIFLFTQHEILTTSSLRQMGRGEEMLEIILILQFIGIYLFLPAIMSGAITQEKERDSLVLLLLTDLGPWEVVLQKYISGLVPMLSFLLLSLPLAAIAYAFGGVAMHTLVSGVWMLFLACLQMGALSLMFSSFCRTTVSSFLCSYLLGAAFFFSLPVLSLACSALGIYPLSQAREFYLSLVPPGVFGTLHMSNSPGTPMAAFARIMIYSAPIMISTVVFLVLARVFLVRRAFVPPGNRLIKAFRRLDEFLKWANRLVGGITLGTEKSHLPGDEPVTWRELTKKPMGRVRYMVRLLLPVEVIVVVIGGFIMAGSMAGSSYGRDTGGLTTMITLLWIMAVIALSVQGANAIVSERVNQTLEVLLTTPLECEDIVRQKTRVMRRLSVMFMVPFLTIYVMESWMENNMGWGNMELNSPSVLYIFCSALSVLVYLPLASWLSLWIGLKMKTRFRAILTALGVIAVWCIAPFLLVMAINNMDSQKLGEIFLVVSVLVTFSLGVWVVIWTWLNSGWIYRAVLTASSVAALWPMITLITLLVPAMAFSGRPTHMLLLLSPISIIGFNESGEIQSLFMDADSFQASSYSGAYQSRFFDNPFIPWQVVTMNFACYGILLLFFRSLCLRGADKYLRGK